MGERITLTASDGFVLGAYVARPAGTPRGGIVVLQEIFGVNAHIRAVADLFADEGYLTVAPALYDRSQRDFEVGYTPEDVTQGRTVVMTLDQTKALADISAAIDYAKAGGKVGVVGYCWGGTMTYAAACQLDGVSSAVGYYGGGIAGMKADRPRVPTLLNFGARDAHIPMDSVEAIRAAQPSVEIHVYDAEHGFNCDHRGSYDQASADLARARTLDWFARDLAA